MLWSESFASFSIPEKPTLRTRTTRVIEKQRHGVCGNVRSILGCFLYYVRCKSCWESSPRQHCITLGLVHHLILSKRICCTSLVSIPSLRLETPLRWTDPACRKFNYTSEYGQWMRSPRCRIWSSYPFFLIQLWYTFNVILSYQIRVFLEDARSSLRYAVCCVTPVMIHTSTIGPCFILLRSERCLVTMCPRLDRRYFPFLAHLIKGHCDWNIVIGSECFNDVCSTFSPSHAPRDLKMNITKFQLRQT